ncbi:MAG: hypothetical protein IAF38_10675 [Bacteroidia bacterium]|nr:hypothetical protein [Bacteroidia bacterium]
MKVTKRKKIIYFGLLILLIVIIDLIPILYYKIFGSGGSYAVAYALPFPNDTLVKKIHQNFDDEKTNSSMVFYSSAHNENGSGWTRFTLLDKHNKQYFHLWVETSGPKNIDAPLVFYGSSSSSDYKECPRINGGDV